MIEKIVTGIILDKFPFEDEHLIKVLVENGDILTLKAKGLDNLSSKNRISLSPFNTCELEYFTNGSGKSGRLKTSRIIKEFLKDTEQAYYILEIIRNLLNGSKKNSEVTYDSIKIILDSLENNTYNFQKILSLMIIILRQEGYNPMINACVKCGTNKNIKGFSLYEGGLICELHQKGKDYFMEPNLIRKIIEINMVINPNDCKDLLFLPKEISILKSMYKLFLENQLGLNLYLISKI